MGQTHYPKPTLYKKCQELFISSPSILWLTIFFVLPTLIVISFAARKPDIVQGTLLPEYSLTSLCTVFEDWETYVTAFRTIWLSLAATSISLIISLPVAYYMAQLQKSKQHKLLVLILLPFWSSFLVRIFAWKTLLHPEGTVKSLLVFFHIIDESTSLLYNNVAVLTVMVYSYLPFAILPLYTQASKFDFQLIEAALDLGASRTRAFFQIFIPSMRSALVTASIMVLIPVAGAYIIPDVIGGVDSEMLGNKIAQKVFVDRNMPEASSYSVMLACILGVLVYIMQLLKGPTTSDTEKKL